MTEQECENKVIEILKEKCLKYSRAYRAFEGGVRVIGVEPSGREHRFSFSRNGDNVWLEEM